MNRAAKLVDEGSPRVPRASGDEPDFAPTLRKCDPCSPRERG